MSSNDLTLLSQPAVNEMTAQRDSSVPGAEQTKSRTAAKLLVIDDQPSVSRVIRLIAEQIGLEVKALTSSAQATEVFIDYRPDIVVLDIFMPEKDGIDILNEILTTGISAHIIMTSAYSDSHLRLAAGVARFHDYDRITVLKKPFRREQLLDALRQALVH